MFRTPLARILHRSENVSPIVCHSVWICLEGSKHLYPQVFWKQPIQRLLFVSSVRIIFDACSHNSNLETKPRPSNMERNGVVSTNLCTALVACAVLHPWRSSSYSRKFPKFKFSNTAIYFSHNWRIEHDNFNASPDFWGSRPLRIHFLRIYSTRLSSATLDDIPLLIPQELPSIPKLQTLLSSRPSALRIAVVEKVSSSTFTFSTLHSASPLCLEVLDKFCPVPRQ